MIGAALGMLSGGGGGGGLSMSSASSGGNQKNTWGDVDGSVSMGGGGTAPMVMMGVVLVVGLIGGTIWLVKKK